MTREELKESVKVLKKSAKNTVGNREKNNKFTVIADIKPDSFDYIMSQVIEALSEPTKTEPTRTKAKWIEIVKEHKCYGRDDTYTTTEYQCSACGAKPLAKYASDEAGDAFSAFCPNCGAEMESEE